MRLNLLQNRDTIFNVVITGVDENCLEERGELEVPDTREQKGHNLS